GYEAVCRANRDANTNVDTDAAMACLRRAKASFTATIDALVEVDDALLVRAADMVEGLPEPGRCAFDAGPAEPPSIEVARLRDELAAIGVLLASARWLEADARREAVLARARELDHPALLAEALLEHGRAIINSRDQLAGLPV